jgi:hypothetical protein
MMLENYRCIEIGDAEAMTLRDTAYACIYILH